MKCVSGERADASYPMILMNEISKLKIPAFVLRDYAIHFICHVMKRGPNPATGKRPDVFCFLGVANSNGICKCKSFLFSQSDSAFFFLLFVGEKSL